MKITPELAANVLKNHDGDVFRGTRIHIKDKKRVSEDEFTYLVRDGKLYLDGELCDWEQTRRCIILRYQDDIFIGDAS